jgi:predicted RNase H-like HicB family nuclease
MNMPSVKLANVVWKEGKHFVAQCLNVDVSSFGNTKKEALDNLNEALELYFHDEPSTLVNEITQPEVISTKLNYA